MKITVRPATKLPKIIIHRKAAAYCRASTLQEIQHHSLEAQLCCAYAGRDSLPMFPSGNIVRWRWGPTHRPTARRAVGINHSSPFRCTKKGEATASPFLVRRKGLEPPTLGTGIRCSIH